MMNKGDPRHTFCILKITISWGITCQEYLHFESLSRITHHSVYIRIRFQLLMCVAKSSWIWTSISQFCVQFQSFFFRNVTFLNEVCLKTKLKTFEFGNIIWHNLGEFWQLKVVLSKIYRSFDALNVVKLLCSKGGILVCWLYLFTLYLNNPCL